MRICVLNGSPKGSSSITLQTCLYLEAKHPEHQWDILHVGQRIRSYEKDFGEAKQLLEAAELLLFAYPVYTFLAPSQLHRFLALMKENGVSVAGKYATQITTSKHFYDVTAHRYIEDNCHDMGLRVIHGLSADMEDLLKSKGQANAEAFWGYVTHCMTNRLHEPAPEPGYQPRAYLPCGQAAERRDGFDTVVVADSGEGSPRLQQMLEDFRRVYPYPVRVVDIAEYPFSGGCLGCFHCAGDGRCIYKDGFDEFLRQNIQKADAIVYAFTARDHSMGWRFKRYDDRQFCNGHRTVTEGTPFGYLADGDIPREENLRMVLEARAEVGGNYLAGIGYDGETVAAMASRLVYALEHKYAPPRNFYGVGGMKIFRDLIWEMRGLMKADHDFFKAHGIYDFPQKRWGNMLKMKLLGALVRSPKVKAKMGSKMSEGMIAPYRKVLEKETGRNSGQGRKEE